ncbi:MAG: PEP-CTERM sorting domain-containing protein [Planctomycetota bacterium]
MKTGTIALFVLLVASAAVGGINTDKPLGPLDLYIEADGMGIMVNNTDAPFSFDGYSVASAAGLIDPDAFYGLGGDPHLPRIPEPWLFPPPGEPMPLAVLSKTAWMVSEASLTSYITLPADAEIDLGRAFPGGTQADLTFTYVYSASGESYEGRVIPEPSTLALLGLSALVATRRRGRALPL